MKEMITIKLIADDEGHIGVYSTHIPAIGGPVTPLKDLGIELINLAVRRTGEHVMQLNDVTSPQQTGAL